MMKLSYHGVSMVLPITSEISYINQLTEPQQAPTSSIPGIQVCQSCAGAVLHAQHLTFLEFHTSVKPRYIICSLFCSLLKRLIGY
ncbi:hypothetical protein PRUPE_1G012500 [Prunus persica]|uniref:Uncharacterized protein n=1 Tax=Prunus persica TaxID=3760 RepID=A0A251QR53_PRUPE|nr:hypothetical protein PRUPE_1G012500 [Prunus persica]